MSTKQKVYALYKEIFKTDDEPDTFELARLCGIVMQAAAVSYDAEERIGKDVLDLFKRHAKVKRGSVDVDASGLARELDEMV